MKKYRGWWCPWCSTWVDGKDVEVPEYDKELHIHTECGYSVDERESNEPIVPSPPSSEVVEAQNRYHDMLSDFIREAK